MWEVVAGNALRLRPEPHGWRRVNLDGLGMRLALGGQEVGSGTRSDKKVLFSSWHVLRGFQKL